MNEQQQIKVYGDTIQGIREAVIFADLNDPADLINYAMGILSDAQHVAVKNPEMANQFINKSKYFMGEANSILLNRKRA